MAVTATFLGDGTATAGLTISFNVNCGAADPSKVIVVALHQTGGVGSKLITALTVDGINCLANAVQGQRHGSVWCALPSSSGIVAVDVTYDNAPGTFYWGAWNVLESSGSPTDTQSTFTNTDATRSLAMTIPVGGVCLVTGTRVTSTAITTTNATEDYDNSNGTRRHVGAHTTSTGSVSPQFADVSSMVGFAFGPVVALGRSFGFILG